MPRKPDGDVAMTSTERVHRLRERQRKVNPPQTDRQKLAQARAEIERLKAELAAARAGKTEAAQPRAPHAEPEKTQQAHGAQTKSTSKRQATADLAEMAARVRASYEAGASERAKWGGRPRERVTGDIRRLLVSRGVRRA